MSKLKVYQGSLDGRHAFCVATSSRARVVTIAKISGYHVTIGYISEYWSVSGNPAQVAATTAAPGVLMRETEPGKREYKPAIEFDNRKPFGSAHMVEMREIEASLADRGLSPMELHFEAIQLYELAHKDDLTYRQKSIRRRKALAEFAAANPAPRSRLNAEEIAYLIDRLSGVNDPIGASAREVLERMHVREVMP